MKTRKSVAGASRIKIALAPFLYSCPDVVTLGIRPCLDDYSEHERKMLLDARRVFFPTPKYVDIFQACQIPTFPRPTTYRYQRSRILQQLLFHYLDCPHVRSRVYYGKRQKKRILDHFRLPILIMGAGNVPGTIHIVHNIAELERLINMQHAIIVREFIQWTLHVQLICVQFDVIGALRLVSGKEGAVAAAEPVDLHDAALTKPISITKQLLLSGQLDDILIEWGCADGNWQLHGMGRPPVRWPTNRGTMNRHQHICELIQSGVL